MSEKRAKQTIYLPQFTIGEGAFEDFGKQMRSYGSKAVICHGKTAWEASKAYVLPELEAAGITVCAQVLYGHEATMERVIKITENPVIKQADFLIAVGGGKCIDTVKLAADQLDKPVFTIPSIASNCAPITQISILYHEDGSFREISRLKRVPIHCFIHPRIILEAPGKYLWAGVGDAMAKHVESQWSAKAGELLDFGSEFGITAGRMCFYPMLAYAKKALEDQASGIVSGELEETIINVVISPGITSVSVRPEYNGGIAHALFYGLTKRKQIEQHHLHGEVVSYGALVNLMVDRDMVLLQKLFSFHKEIGLPVCLKDLEIETKDPLEDVLEATLANQELVHTPYPITKEMIYQAIMDLESYDSTLEKQEQIK